MMDGLSQLADGVGVADLSNRGRVLVVGADAAKLLNNLCTNDILKLQPGQWCEAFFLNAKGGVLFYARVLRTGEEAFLLDLDPGLAETVVKHIDRYIIREKAKVEDVSFVTFHSHHCGGRMGMKRSNIQDLGITAWIFDIRRTPFPGFDLIGPIEGQVESAWKAKPTPTTDVSISADMDRLRILAGLPAFGKEIVEGCLAQEIDRNEQAISFTKGCYIGQETVARLDAMGHVNKILRGLLLEGIERPADGAKIVFNEREVGSVSSSAVSLDEKTVKCLAIMRIAAATPGTQVTIDGRTAVVSALPFE
jgi:folate-binding protein YgfZ